VCASAASVLPACEPPFRSLFFTSAMTSVDSASLDVNLHLFRNDTTRLQQPQPPQHQQEQSVPASDVALSPPQYPAQSTSQSLQPSSIQDERPEQPNKGFGSQDPSLTVAGSSSTAIQMLEGESTDQTIGVPVDEVGSSDDSQEWTEGDSQEHKRVKVCLLQLPSFPRRRSLLGTVSGK
jgi:hypothetical protein